MLQINTPRNLKPLTSLRFVAALWVALFSFWPHLDVAGTPMIIAKGYLGVELFFVLSGFIIAHVYLERFGQKRFSYRAFVAARLARIYPLHLAALLTVLASGLAASAAGIAISDNVLHWPSLIPNLLMINAWGVTDVAGWNHPSWSVSAEWFAYLTFPAYALAAWRLRQRPLIALGLAIGLMIGLYLGFPRLTGSALTQATYHWGALRIVPCFAYGCALYLAYRQHRPSRPWVGIGIGAAMMILSTGLIGSDLLTVLSAGSLIVSLAGLDHRQTGPLAHRAAVWLGEISYAVYIFSAPWLMLSVNLMARLTSSADKVFSWPLWSLLILGLLGLAAIAHRLIEQPARRAIRQVSPSQPSIS